MKGSCPRQAVLCCKCWQLQVTSRQTSEVVPAHRLRTREGAAAGIGDAFRQCGCMHACLPERKPAVFSAQQSNFNPTRDIPLLSILISFLRLSLAMINTTILAFYRHVHLSTLPARSGGAPAAQLHQPVTRLVSTSYESLPFQRPSIALLMPSWPMLCSLSSHGT